jgi:hypothetical protein
MLLLSYNCIGKYFAAEYYQSLDLYVVVTAASIDKNEI